jgi:hypothetical protein
MISNFSLVGVENGWFKALFYDYKNSILLWATDIGGYDVGKKLINAVCSLCSNKLLEENICFNAESVAHLLKIRRIDSDFSIKIYKLLFDPFDFIGEVSIPNDYIKDGEIIFETTGELKSLAMNIFMEFLKYNCKDLQKAYEVNWFPFPKDEIEKLRSIIKTR